jgi:Peptidase C39 family
MRITSRRAGSAFTCRCLGSFISLLVLANAAVGAAPEQTRPNDCRVNALFILLRLEGRRVTLDRLESALPPRHPDGYSMAELAAASGSLDLPLDGVQFGRGAKPLDRPAIAFVQDARGGHFSVLRPVGTTGTMVQLIDPPHPPWIGDYDRLFAGSSWTGRILLPKDPWTIRYAALFPLSAAGLLIVVAAIRHRRHRTISFRRGAAVVHSPDHDPSGR